MKEGKKFYRCTLCNSVVNAWDIKTGKGCPKCGATKLSPTNLSAWEKLVQLCKHPNVRAWPPDLEMKKAAFTGRPELHLLKDREKESGKIMGSIEKE